MSRKLICMFIASFLEAISSIYRQYTKINAPVAKWEACFPVASRLLAAICVSCFAGDLAEPTDASRTEKVKKSNVDGGWASAARTTVCAVSIIFCIYLVGLLLLLLVRLFLSSDSLLALFRSTAKPRRAYERTGSQITIDPYAWRLREASPPFERDSFSHSRTRGTRINACSGHRKYLSDTHRLAIPTKVDEWL